MNRQSKIVAPRRTISQSSPANESRQSDHMRPIIGLFRPKATTTGTLSPHELKRIVAAAIG